MGVVGDGSAIEERNSCSKCAHRVVCQRSGTARLVDLALGNARTLRAGMAARLCFAIEGGYGDRKERNVLYADVLRVIP